MKKTTSRSSATISSTSAKRLRSAATAPDKLRINMESTNVVGVVRDPKPQRAKSGRRTRYVDLESPRPPTSRSRSRSKSPLTIQIEDVEGSAMLVSPTAKSRKKKGRRSAKRKQLDNALHDDRDQTQLRRAKSTSVTKTSPKKKT